LARPRKRKRGGARKRGRKSAKVLTLRWRVRAGRGGRRGAVWRVRVCKKRHGVLLFFLFFFMAIDTKPPPPPLATKKRHICAVQFFPGGGRVPYPTYGCAGYALAYLLCQNCISLFLNWPFCDKK
jgi:hypothetical protein